MDVHLSAFDKSCSEIAKHNKNKYVLILTRRKLSRHWKKTV